MTMACAGWAADGAGVEDQMVRLHVPATPHHRVAAVRKEYRRRAYRRPWEQRVEGIQPHWPEHPAIFWRRPASPGVVRSTEEGGGHREDASGIIWRPRSQREEPAAVCIADLGHRAVGTAHREEEVEHPL